MSVLTMPLHLGPSAFPLTTNVATRWIHHNFDASACFDGCNNIAEVLERSIGSTVSCAFRVAYCRLYLLLSAFPIWVLASSITWWTAFLHPLKPYQVLTTTSSTTCGILCWKCFSSSRLVAFCASFVVEVDLAKIALTCHFALDVLCFQEDSAWRLEFL